MIKGHCFTNVVNMLTEQEMFDLIPSPKNAVFSLVEVRKITHPHPYCITPKHVEIASDYHSGILGKSAIEDAEKRGAICGTKIAGQRCNLSYDKHITEYVLFVKCPQNKDLNTIPGLHAYLLSIKEQAEKLGISGFAFPT